MIKVEFTCNYTFAHIKFKPAFKINTYLKKILSNVQAQIDKVS